MNKLIQSMYCLAHRKHSEYSLVLFGFLYMKPLSGFLFISFPHRGTSAHFRGYLRLGLWGPARSMRNTWAQTLALLTSEWFWFPVSESVAMGFTGPCRLLWTPRQGGSAHAKVPAFHTSLWALALISRPLPTHNKQTPAGSHTLWLKKCGKGRRGELLCSEGPPNSSLNVIPGFVILEWKGLCGHRASPSRDTWTGVEDLG